MPKISAVLVQGDAGCVSAEVEPVHQAGSSGLEVAPYVLVFGCDLGSVPLHESGDLGQGGGHLVGAGVNRPGAGPAGGSQAVGDSFAPDAQSGHRPVVVLAPDGVGGSAGKGVPQLRCGVDDDGPSAQQAGGVVAGHVQEQLAGARHAAGLLTVQLESDAEFATLVVSDDGPGIPAESRVRVFERFTRLDPARARDTGGVGLGLAIVADVVAAHGGTVVAQDNRPGARMVLKVSLSPGRGPGLTR